MKNNIENSQQQETPNEERINWKPAGWVMLCIIIILAFFNWKLSLMIIAGGFCWVAFAYAASTRPIGRRL